MVFAKALLDANPNIVFCYISGSQTDSSEKGRFMWARIKGKTENDLARLGFRNEYNFRPGAMSAFPQQKKAKKLYIAIVKIISYFSTSKIISLSDLGKAMIHSVERKYAHNILEIKDIKDLAK